MSSEEIKTAWENRDRLAAELERENRMPLRTLYVRLDDGGTLAFALLKDGCSALLIDWKNSGYQVTVLTDPKLSIEPYARKEEGFGGMFGFGEKGALGWMLRLINGETVFAEAPILPNITAIADALRKGDPFFAGKQKLREAPLDRLRPEDRETCRQILSLWERLTKERKPN